MTQLVEVMAEPQAEERILLVDDSPTNLQVLLQTLSGRGYKLLIAKNGENAAHCRESETGFSIARYYDARNGWL